MKKILTIILCLFSFALEAKDSVRLVVPYSPGGPVDLVARVAQQDLSEALNRPVILEYKPGAGGDIGTAFVANSNPRETVLMITSAGLVINQATKKSLYNENNLIPLFNFGSFPLVLVVPAQSKLRTISDWRKLSPTTSINYGSSGVGATTHISGELLKQELGKNLNHIPYKGQGQVIPDLLGGTLDFAFLFSTQAEPYIQSGKLIPVAVVSPVRLSTMPTVPTFTELGIDKLDFYPWFILFSNNTENTKDLDQLQRTLKKIFSNAKSSQPYVNIGLEPPNTPRVLPQNFLSTEKKKWSKLLDKIEIEP